MGRPTSSKPGTGTPPLPAAGLVLVDPPARPKGGRFESGTSGNPAGRPRGSRNRSSVAARELLDLNGDAIMLKAISLAKEGEPMALRLCVERILPRRSGLIELDMPAIRRAEDVAEGCAAVIEAAGSGKITLSEAREFMHLLEGQRKAIETESLVFRIEMLEKVEPK